MGSAVLIRDPYNLIITGVGGQGNVTASRLVASMLVEKGFVVTVGETFGASQRGGSVMSHVRVSSRQTYSPQIPKGTADLVVSLEPSEALRVAASYGGPRTICLSNDRPVFPVRVIAGEVAYPRVDEIRSSLESLCAAVIMIPATVRAVALGKAVLQNVVMVGALAGLGVLPFTRDDFEGLIARDMPEDGAALNMKAFDAGADLVRGFVTTDMWDEGEKIG